MAVRPKQTTQEHLNYLNGLRETEFVNMLGSARHLAKKFDLPADIARDILIYWYEKYYFNSKTNQGDK